MRARMIRGWSLIELLVVMAVVSVVAAALTLRWGQGSESLPFTQTLNRVATLASQQCELALLEASVRGIGIDSQGYALWRHQREGWQRLPHSAQPWAQGLQARLWVDGHAVRLSNTQPQIVCDPLGQRSAFELELFSADAAWRLVVDGLGESTVSRL